MLLEICYPASKPFIYFLFARKTKMILLSGNKTPMIISGRSGFFNLNFEAGRGIFLGTNFEVRARGCLVPGIVSFYKCGSDTQIFIKSRVC